MLSVYIEVSYRIGKELKKKQKQKRDSWVLCQKR